MWNGAYYYLISVCYLTLPRILFLSSITWVLGVELILSGWAADDFTC